MNLPKSMNAAVLFNLNNYLKIVKLKIPELKKGQVLVKIFYSAICRSQLEEIYGGRKDNKKWLPHLLGHEATGEVIAVGSGVRKVFVNDKVILTWLKCQGIEANCPIYRFKNKNINAGRVTTFSNYSIVSESRIIKKPRNLDYKSAVLFGCSFMTGPGMVFNDVKINNNSKVVLIGLGAIGLGIYLALKKKGVKNIIIIEKNKRKILMGRKLGLRLYFSKISKNTIKKVFNVFEGGADICFESAGNVKTIEFAIKLIKKNGLVHFASHPNYKEFIKIYPHDLILGKRITGSWGGGCFPDVDIKRFTSLIKKRKNFINNILKKEYKLKDINKALIDFKNEKVFRPIIKMTH